MLDILVWSRRTQEAAEAYLHRVVDGCGYQGRGREHGYAGQLPARRAARACGSGAPAAHGREHLRRSRAPAHSPARTGAPAIQIAGARPSTPSSSSVRSVPSPPTSDHFRPRRHLLPAPTYHQLLQIAAHPLRHVARRHGPRRGRAVERLVPTRRRVSIAAINAVYVTLPSCGKSGAPQSRYRATSRACSA